MALDFGILQPIDIAGQIASGRQEAQRNQLAQQQLAMGGLQQQKAELELGDFKRRQSALDQFVQDAAKNNKSGSEEDMLNSYGEYARAIGDPTHIMHHQELTMALKERQRFNQEQMGGRPQPPSAAAAPSATGPSAPIDEAMKLDYIKNARPGVTYEDFAASQNTGLAAPVAARTPVVTAPLQAPGMTPAPVINNLPAAAAAPTASVNQLAAPAVMSPAQLQAEITRLGIEYPKGTAKGKIAILTKQLEDATKTHVVGDSLVDNTGRVIVTIPKTATPSEFEQLLAKTNLTENQKIAMRVARATKESTHAPPISVSYGQEKAEASDYGKLLVKGYEGIQTASNLAQKSLPAIESNLAILDKGFDTGFATETKAAGAKVLAALGVKEADKYATDAQTFLANASAAVLQRQLEQKGPQTESDAQRITATGAQLGNTKDANRFVLSVAKAQLQRDIAQRNFYADWRKEHKTFDGADDAWNGGPGSKSLFDNPALKKYSVNVVDQIPGQAPASGGFKYLGKESSK
jgi:hypothetical protein